jgi:hypothetical protein
MGDEAAAVGVAAADAGVRKDDGVHGAGAAGGVVHLVAHREGGELVRLGDVQTAEAGGAQAAHGGGEVVRADGQRHVGAVDAVAVEPEAVQPGRARVRDRPAGDAGKQGAAGQDRGRGGVGHAPKNLRLPVRDQPRRRRRVGVGWRHGAARGRVR